MAQNALSSACVFLVLIICQQFQSSGCRPLLLGKKTEFGKLQPISMPMSASVGQQDSPFSSSQESQLPTPNETNDFQPISPISDHGPSVKHSLSWLKESRLVHTSSAEYFRPTTPGDSPGIGHSFSSSKVARLVHTDSADYFRPTSSGHRPGIGQTIFPSSKESRLATISPSHSPSVVSVVEDQFHLPHTTNVHDFQPMPPLHSPMLSVRHSHFSVRESQWPHSKSSKDDFEPTDKGHNPNVEHSLLAPLSQAEEKYRWLSTGHLDIFRPTSRRQNLGVGRRLSAPQNQAVEKPLLPIASHSNDIEPIAPSRSHGVEYSRGN